MERLMSLLGIFVFLSIAYALSNNKTKIDRRLVINGMLLQLILGLLVLGIPALSFEGPLQFLFLAANNFILKIIMFTQEGLDFLMGSLASIKNHGFIFAIHALGPIIFFSSLMSVLYHLGIMQKIVRFTAAIMTKVLGTSGAESLSMAANIFVGQTEAPLVVKPYIAKMTPSELMALMTGGFATVAGGVLAGFVGMLAGKIPNIAGHLLTASVMSAPAAFVFAKIIYPETDQPDTQGKIPTKSAEESSVNVIDAAAKGASDGVKMAINVAAMVLAFIALVAAFNALLGTVGEWANFSQWGHDLVSQQSLVEGKAVLSLQVVLGWIFSPLAFLMGIPWSEAGVAGSLLGKKMVINEFVAYIDLSLITHTLSERTAIILSYALCGFANFSSIAIQIGGIGEIAPTRKAELAKFGMKAMIGGTLAAFMTASIASLLI